MSDNTPIIIYEETRLHNFFLFTLTAADYLVFDKKFIHFNPDLSEESKDAQSRLNSLTDSMMLTTLDDENRAFSSFSLKNFSVMLSLIDAVAKYLISRDDAYSRNLILEVSTVSGVPPDWDKFFLTEAQFVFDEMKELFKNDPDVLELIAIVTGNSQS